MQKLGNSILNLETSLLQRLWVNVRVRVHVGAVSRLRDDQRLSSWADWVEDTQGVPGVNETVGKKDIGERQVESAIEAVGKVN